MDLKIEELRKANNLTKKELSKKLELQESTYGNYELHKRQIPVETLIKLADLYKVSLDYLVGRQFKNELGYLSDEDIEIIKVFLALSHKNKLITFGMMSNMLQNQKDED